MNSLDEQYKTLLKTIIQHGIRKEDRTGTGTQSIFGYTIRHNMQEGFPILTTKKMAWKQIVTELLWFLRGDTNIEFLHKHGCHIWDGDYEKSGRTDGSLGPIYGKQWRSWTAHTSNKEDSGYFYGIDQMQNLINDLKTNPDSRRLLVNAWNVADLKKMTLPPCHIGFQLYTREMGLDERIDLHNRKSKSLQKSSDYFEEHMDMMGIPKRAISLMWNQRSVDTFLGLPFNIASYGLLLEIIAKEVEMMPDQLIGNLGDTHLYINHLDQAAIQIDRKSYKLPKLSIEYSTEIGNQSRFDYLEIDDIKLTKYNTHPQLKAPLSN